MDDASGLIGVVFAALSPLIIEAVTDQGEVIQVRARTPGKPVACPDCGALSARMHTDHERTVADVPLDARPVSVAVRVRRPRCSTAACARPARLP